ncbi:hypothetical protein GCM10010363_33080 [Streptomyces omiyaensis]|nr:hypothetical protein GCM10010363_33080 [Streptomyces omiyaensis]
MVEEERLVPLDASRRRQDRGPGGDLVLPAALRPGDAGQEGVDGAVARPRGGELGAPDEGRGAGEAPIAAGAVEVQGQSTSGAASAGGTARGRRTMP